MNIKSLYELFKEYTSEEVDEVVSTLSPQDQTLIYERYGDDLNNPKPTENWDETKSKAFYGRLVPKIKRKLQKNKKDPLENNLILPSFQSTNDIENLIEMIEKGKTTTEICKSLKIDNKRLSQMLTELKYMGSFIPKRNYHENGQIGYTQSKKEEIYGDKEIITNSRNLRILAISDLHIGNELERPDLLYRAFNYCAKEGIHLIMCCGDILDGTYTAGEQNIPDVYKQLNKFLNTYPKDDNILTFAVGGDHDESVLNNYGLDIIPACYHYRPDIVIGDYRNVSINIANDKLHLYHKGNKNKIDKDNPSIVLRGHSHIFKTGIHSNRLHITVPTLSGITKALPSALDLNLSLNKNGKFQEAIIEHIYFGDKDMILGYQTFKIPNKSFVQIEKSEISSSKEKTLIKTPLSPIEKFNQRYGNYIERYK